MTIRTEADYQAVMQRLSYLLDHEPTNVAEITSLGDLANTYENENGHRPLPANSLVARLEREMRTRNLADQQLAELLGIPVAHLRAVLNGHSRIDLELAKRLHGRLGIPGDFILEAA